MAKKETVNVQGTEVAVMSHRQDDYISLTDIAKYKDAENPRFITQNWMRNRNTFEFLGILEVLYNPDFNRVEFEAVRTQAGLNSFVMTPQKWIDATSAIGVTSKAGRYGGGTFAHKEIAYEFASWVSVEFKLYLVKEFDRLKVTEQHQQSREWNLQRTLSKINYRIHTDAIKEQIIPKEVTRAQTAMIYASEADLLNVALFGMTAAEWRAQNPDRQGNVRDFATLEQLVVLSNMESINALLIRQDMSQGERLMQLNNTAITQLKSLVDAALTKRLKQ
jgi:phage regulator Rha-like protein